MKVYKIILIAFFSFSSGSYILKYGKKINKELKKIFKEEIKLKEFELPDQNVFGSENSFYIIESGEKTLGYININRVNACRAGGCDKPGIIDIVSYDHFYYMMVLDTDLSILKVSVLDYQSEHGYEICSKGWLKQFIGSTDKEFVYNKNIDAISGATVSVNAIIDEINYINGQLVRLVEEKRM